MKSTKIPSSNQRTFGHITFSFNSLSSRKDKAKQAIIKQIIKRYDHTDFKQSTFKQLNLFQVLQKDLVHVTKCSQQSYDHSIPLKPCQYCQHYYYDQINPRYCAQQYDQKSMIRQRQQNSVYIQYLPRIQFTNLKYLNLSNHNIYSIQFISFMQTKNLKSLDLHSNNIVNINSLIKSNLSNLQSLMIENNHLNQINKICKCNLNALIFYTISKSERQKYLTDNVFMNYKMKNSQPIVWRMYQPIPNRLSEEELIQKHQLINQELQLQLYYNQKIHVDFDYRVRRRDY